jgi:hypothetical protein
VKKIEGSVDKEMASMKFLEATLYFMIIVTLLMPEIYSRLQSVNLKDYDKNRHGTIILQML